MRRKTRVIALLAAIVMTSGLFAVSATAAGQASITIDNVSVGQTYSAYQIMNMTTNGSGGFAYTAATGWDDFFTAEGAALFNVDSAGNISKKDAATAAQIAAAAIEYATDNSIVPDATETPATTAPVVFANLPYGYYVVDSTVGAICSLTSNHEDRVIHDKNYVPSLGATATSGKQVEENGTWVKSTTAYIGDNRNFRIRMEDAPNFVGNDKIASYTIHDTMDAGMTLVDGTIVVKVNGVALAATAYSIATDHGTHDFCVTIPWVDGSNNPLYTATTGTVNEIEVAYQAYLNESAVIGNKAAANGNKNAADVTWKIMDGNTPVDPTDPAYPETSEVIVYTWGLAIEKVDGADTAVKLANAEFSVYKDAECTQILTFHQDAGGVYYVDAGDKNDETTTTVVSDANGMINIKGLETTTYYVVETKAPDGYNKLTAAVNKAVGGTADSDVYAFTVENNKGTEMPSTGGIGTTIFYVIGIIMMGGAAILLITKKIVEKKKNA